MLSPAGCRPLTYPHYSPLRRMAVYVFAIHIDAGTRSVYIYMHIYIYTRGHIYIHVDTYKHILYTFTYTSLSVLADIGRTQVFHTESRKFEFGSS